MFPMFPILFPSTREEYITLLACYNKLYMCVKYILYFHGEKGEHGEQRVLKTTFRNHVLQLSIAKLVNLERQPVYIVLVQNLLKFSRGSAKIDANTARNESCTLDSLLQSKPFVIFVSTFDYAVVCSPAFE